VTPPNTRKGEKDLSNRKAKSGFASLLIQKAKKQETKPDSNSNRGRRGSKVTLTSLQRLAARCETGGYIGTQFNTRFPNTRVREKCPRGHASSKLNISKTCTGSV